MTADSSENLLLSQRKWRARTSHNCQKPLHIIANKNEAASDKKNVFLDLSQVAQT